jgi:hypothetical protein
MLADCASVTCNVERLAYSAESMHLPHSEQHRFIDDFLNLGQSTSASAMIILIVTACHPLSRVSRGVWQPERGGPVDSTNST